MVRRELGPILDGTVALQQGRQLDDGLVPFIGAESNRPIGAGAKVGMILVNQLIAVGGRKLRKCLFPPGISSLVYDLLERVNIHSLPVASGNVRRSSSPLARRPAL
jgi:hypothetical protein